jgi:hypothetical protein
VLTAKPEFRSSLLDRLQGYPLSGSAGAAPALHVGVMAATQALSASVVAAAALSAGVLVAVALRAGVMAVKASRAAPRAPAALVCRLIETGHRRSRGAWTIPVDLVRPSGNLVHQTLARVSGPRAYRSFA